MTTESLFESFVLDNTIVRDKINPSTDYIKKYGKVPFEEGFKTYVEELNHFHSLKVKIRKFEDFLIANDVKVVHSNISESRYFYYKGKKYRFSSHVYPTGSMTDDILDVVDLAADPELINEVDF